MSVLAYDIAVLAWDSSLFYGIGLLDYGMCVLFYGIAILFWDICLIYGIAVPVYVIAVLFCGLDKREFVVARDRTFFASETSSSCSETPSGVCVKLSTTLISYRG